MSDFDHQKQAGLASETLEQTRHNYSVQAQISESDDNSHAGVMIKSSQQGKGGISGHKKDGRSINDLLMMNDTFQSLAAMENMMVKKYGEDFDLHLAAEFLDDETYKKLASIKDIDQRREAVAQAIHEGIENGSISAEAVDAFSPEFGQWANKRVEHGQEMTLKREAEIHQNVENASKLSSNSSLENDTLSAFGSA